MLLYHHQSQYECVEILHWFCKLIAVVQRRREEKGGKDRTRVLGGNGGFEGEEAGRVEGEEAEKEKQVILLPPQHSSLA